MNKSIRIITNLILLMSSVPSTYCQELTIVAKERYFLSDHYPNPCFSRGHYESKEKGGIVEIGDTITIFAYHKSMDWTFIYNKKKTGYIWGIRERDKQLYKQIKKTKVLDYNENASDFKIKQQKIYSAINRYYDRLADIYDRKIFVKDSIEKRQEFIADSIQKRERFIRDSIAKVEKRRQDSIKWTRQEEQRELKILEDIETYEQKDPFILDVMSWMVDHEITMSLNVRFTNCSRKVVKYVTMKGRFYNRVNDPVRELWKGGYEWRAVGIGPLYPAPRTLEEYEDPQGKYEGKSNFNNLYYFYDRNVVSTIKVTSVTIEYMDGTKRTITGKELQKHVIYSCH